MLRTLRSYRSLTRARYSRSEETSSPIQARSCTLEQQNIINSGVPGRMVGIETNHCDCAYFPTTAHLQGTPFEFEIIRSRAKTRERSHVPTLTFVILEQPQASRYHPIDKCRNPENRQLVSAFLYFRK